jgi:hypothetical protein
MIKTLLKRTLSMTCRCQTFEMAAQDSIIEDILGGMVFTLKCREERDWFRTDEKHALSYAFRDSPRFNYQEHT